MSSTDRVDASVWRVVAVAAIGSFMSQLDATVVNVSLSSLAASLHAGLSTIQWVTSGYLLALALMLPLNGWLVDRIGAKALYLGCFTAFTLSSTLCGLAWSSASLVGFRVLQGMSGGLLAPMAQMMIARAAGRQMAQVVSIGALPVLLAPLLGPVIAGAILQFASWRWLFLINLPVGVVALGLAAIFLPNDHAEAKRRRLDFTGLALLSPALVFFLYGSDHLGEGRGQALFAASLAMLAAFIWLAARKGDAALIDLRLFKGRVFSASVVSMFMTNGVSFAGQMLIPIYLIRATGLTPSGTGLLLAPLGLGMLCTYPFMGRLVRRFGVRGLSAGGAAIGLVATTPFIFMALNGFSVAILLPALFIRGVGQSAIGLPSISAAYASVPKADLPMATTAMNIVQRLGGPTLTTVCATFLGWRLAEAHRQAGGSDAFAATFALLCGIQGLLLLATLRLPAAMPEAA